LAGGTFGNPCTLFRDALIDLVRETAPHVHPSPLLSAPAVGGALLAMEAAGAEASAEVRRRLVEEAREWQELLA
ncbi:MAG TPA: hypothetical protein VKE41_04570, partial [Roseiflexaceae bacterium]|nr:hypothetical protein [Roseiflexaceae bacterium]